MGKTGLLPVLALSVCVVQISAVSSQERIAPEKLRHLAVMTTGGFVAAYDVLAPRFEETTGIERWMT